MNTGTAKTTPDTFVQRGDVTQFRYNVREVEKETEQGTETFHKYDYVEVPRKALSYKTLVDACIRNKYDINDEFNLIKKPADDPDRVAYEEYVDQCKQYATEAMS